MAGSIQSSLGNASTLTEIKNSVPLSYSVADITNTQGATIQTPTVMNTLSGMIVASYSEGTTTETTVAEITMLGQLTTTLQGANFTSDDVSNVGGYFETAIAETLQDQGVLPKGAHVIVDDISNSGVVSYSITMHLTPGADNAQVVTPINEKLSLASTLADISTAVKAGAQSSLSTNSIAMIVALSSLEVTGFIAGATTGVSFNLWYPNWQTFGAYCENDGNQPVFMNKPMNVKEYLFSSKTDCCKKWFGHAEDECVGSMSGTASGQFVPDYGSSECSKNEGEDIGTGVARYTTLEECCAAKFSFNMQKCCGSPGMGGCGSSGKVVYLPNWSSLDGMCIARSEATLAPWEVDESSNSMKQCCSDFFPFNVDCVEMSTQS